MDKEFLKDKIGNLSDESLLELLKLNRAENQEVNLLAIEEAQKRNLKIEISTRSTASNINLNENDFQKLKKWNWSAFLIAPIWTLANKLEKWTLLTLIPFANIGVAIYLGSKGNKLAFPKSNIKSIDEFMVLQEKWKILTIRILGISLMVSLIFFIFSLSSE